MLSVWYLMQNSAGNVVGKSQDDAEKLILGRAIRKTIGIVSTSNVQSAFLTMNENIGDNDNNVMEPDTAMIRVHFPLLQDHSPTVNVIVGKPLLASHVKNMAFVAGASESFVLK